MPNLHIVNPGAISPYSKDKNPQMIILNMAIEPSKTTTVEQAIQLKFVKVIQDGPVDVWHAKMDGKSVVAKLVRIYVSDSLNQQAIDNLKKESEFYKAELRELQGIVVPRFFGFYTGYDRVATCMILEHCGETPTRAMTDSKRYK